MIVIGITGTIGAGKGEVVSYFKKKGFVHFSARAALIEEIKKRGLEVNRDSMHIVANELRAAHGAEFLAKLLFTKAQNENKDCIIESIRAVGEIDYLRSKSDFFLIGVDADQKIRYNRIVRRGSDTDKVSFEEFSAQEHREMQSSDPTKHNIFACMQRADIVIENNGTLAGFREKLDEFYGKILEKNRQSSSVGRAPLS